MTITCGIQHAGVTVAMEVLHNSCVTYALMIYLICMPSALVALGIHIRQIPMPMLQPLHVHLLEIYC